MEQEAAQAVKQMLTQAEQAAHNPIAQNRLAKLSEASKRKFLYNRSNQADFSDMMMRWKVANVSPRHAEIDTSYHTHKLWNEYFEMLRDKAGSGYIIAMLGKRGTGKTQLSACLIRYYCEFGFYAQYTTAVEVFLKIKSTFNKDSELKESDVIKEFMAPQLLVIDEFQERSESEWENRIITHMMDMRYREVRDTIVMANLEQAAFVKSVGSSIASRMVETGGVLNFDWETFRKQ